MSFFDLARIENPLATRRAFLGKSGLILSGSAVALLAGNDVLAANTVPTAAAIYTEDLYVEREFSEETAAMVPNLHAWVTSEYDHNGLRADGERILGRLIDLVRGRA